MLKCNTGDAREPTTITDDHIYKTRRAIVPDFRIFARCCERIRGFRPRQFEAKQHLADNGEEIAYMLSRNA